MYRWLRKRIGGLGPDDSAPPARLIDVVACREPSPDLLRRLRALDERAEALYVGQGRWWVGRVKANSPRRPQGRRLAWRARAGDGFAGDQWPELRQGLLMAQGFGLVVDERIQGEPDGRLLAEFAKALHYERTGYQEETEEERIIRDVKADHAREQRVRERDLAKWAFRRLGRGDALSGYGGGSNTKQRSVL